MNEQEKKTILLVEDEILIAMDEAQTIKNFGCYEVILANNGEKAIERALNNENISLVLMDIDLGRGLDGPQAAQKILEKRNIPIIFLTSHSEKEFVNRVKEITRYGYVIKHSGDFVLQSSIEMAFELFEANQKLENELQEHKRTEELLRERDENLQIAQRLSKVGFWKWTLETNEVQWSEELYKLNGYDSKLPVPSFAEMSPFYTTESWKRLNEAVIKAYQTGKLYEIELDLVRTDGIIIKTITRGEADYNASGKIVGLHGTVQDITEQVKTMEELRKSEEQIRAVLHTAMDGFWMVDMQGCFLEVNEAYCHMSGYSEQELLTMNISDIEEIETHTETVNHIEKIMKHEEDRFETRHRRKDGSIFDVEARVQYKPIEGGRIVVFLRDITEHKNAEEALKVSQILYSDLVETAQDLIWQCDSKGCYTYLNHAWEEVFGYKIEEMIGKKFTDFQTPNWASHDLEKFKQLLDGNIIKGLETVHLAKDGKELNLVLNAKYIRDINGKVTGARGIAYNITDRLHAEEILRESEERFRTIYNMEPECVKILNPDYTLVAMNRAGLAMIEADSLEMVKGQSVLLIVDEQFRDDFRKLTDNVCQKGESGKLEFRITGLKGTHRWLETNAVPLRNSRNDITGLLSLTRDITERKQAEEKIKNLLHEKDLILKEVHHRIKNNMNTMTSLLHLQSYAQDNREIKNILLDAEGRIRSMMVLYDKLYRSDNIKAISIKEYFSGLIIDIVHLFSQKGEVEIKTQMDDIILSPDLLSCLGIILNELITNSMKYAFPGRDDGVISITVLNKENNVSIIFEDNGIGIPKSVSIENSPGFGLQLIGLLVDQIDGTLRIEREQGTRIILDFKI